jgi:hypothetical protein
VALRGGIALLALIAVAGAARGQAQTAFKRPRLTADADTNDARAYYDFGVLVLRNEPWKAAAAFYWASRLDPAWAEAFYAQRIAALMAQEHLLIGYLEGNRSVVNSRDAQHLDSLEYQAQRLNPFYERRLQEALFAGYLTALYKRSRSQAGERPLDPADRADLEFMVDQYLRTGSNTFVRAAIAASRGRVAEALELDRQLLPQVSVKAEIHAERAKLFYSVANYDSALAELNEALSELRRRDTVGFTHFYISRELMEHAIGVIHEAAGDTADARAAYGRALQENLAYAPAHVRLAGLDLLAHDSVKALAEFDVAVQVAPNEAPLRAAYALALVQVGRRDEAVVQLRRAVELEPYYAVPHYVLGFVAELAGNRDEALAGYRAFLARAARRDPIRRAVEQRVTDLTP